MRRLFQKLWPWKPGVAVSVAAIPAVILAFDVSPWLKAAGMLVVVGLVSLEIKSIYRENEASDKRWEVMFDRLEEQRKLTVSHVEAVGRLSKVVADPASSLRKRAVELSKEIIDFAYRRMENEPKVSLYGALLDFGKSPTWNSLNSEPTPYQKLLEYNAQTLKVFSERYLASVNNIYRELAEAGVMTQENLAERMGKKLASPLDIRIVGEDIGEFGELVPML
jgi:hypothetical protein